MSEAGLRTAAGVGVAEVGDTTAQPRTPSSKGRDNRDGCGRCRPGLGVGKLKLFFERLDLPLQFSHPARERLLRGK